MNKTFKAGDTVRCTDRTIAYLGFEYGELATVARTNGEGYSFFRNVEGREVSFVNSRFVKVEQEANYILILNKPGGTLAPAGKPRVYTSAKQAETVAASMAKRHPGDTFKVYKEVASAVLPVTEPVVRWAA